MAASDPGSGRPSTWTENQSIFDTYRLSGLTRCESEIFGKYLRRTDRVLDVGCGIGRVTFAVADLSREVVGMDISRTAIEAAQRELERRGVPNIRFLLGSMASPPPDVGTFDRVLIPFNGLEGLVPREQRRKALLALRNHLNEGGLLLLSTHNFHFYWTRLWYRANLLRNARKEGRPGGATTEEPTVWLRTPDGQVRFPYYLYSRTAAEDDLRAAGYRQVEHMAIGPYNPTIPKGQRGGVLHRSARLLIPGYFFIASR